ncbi:MAG TPA: polysaccharide biosynthesis tyrosine autokinase [Opitutaceae bacterium]|nr:polysaccharide biosynthesis tyrosine autokinase [Opitutaceae bacterium]
MPDNHKAPKPIYSSDTDVAVERRTLRDYYVILREHVWLSLPLAIIAAVGFFYVQARKPKVYEATATLQFEKPETVVTSQGVVDPSVRSDTDLNTYIHDIDSNRLRTAVVQSFTPDEKRILQRASLAKLPPGSTPPPAEALLGAIDAEPLRNSYLIAITVRNEDPEAAQLVANRYVEKFMDYLFESVGGKNEEAVTYLRGRAEQLRKDADDSEKQLQDYMRQHNLVSLDKSLDIITDNLKSVNTALTTARLELLSTEELVQEVHDFRRDGKNLLEISYIANHGAVPALKTQLNEAEQTQALLMERYLEKHPKVIDNANKIAVTKAQLDKAVDLAIADLGTRLAAAKDSVKDLDKEYSDQEAKELGLKALSVDFNSLQSRATVAKNYYMEILDRLNQTTTFKNLDKISLHPLDKAQMPGAPVSPNISGIMRTSIGIGFVVFLAIAIGFRFLDDRVKSAWDVESFIGVNLLGIIPQLPTLREDEKIGMAESPAGNETGNEAFLGLYSAAKIQSKLDFPKSILVTSTIPGEGKTLISCNLASCFARHGKKTLIMDCDLRRPMLHRHFRQQNVTGIIAWFEAGAHLDGDILTNADLGIIKISENLWLLTSGGRSKSPTEILENPVFPQLLERMKKQFDLVVVDSPPMGAVTDAMLIAERTDEVIYVCRFNRAFRKHIKLYIKALREGKNEILGIVLNGLSPRRIEYYSNYRYYRSYKKYYGAQT